MNQEVQCRPIDREVERQATKRHCGYIPDVDGLRGLAVVAVLAFHFLPSTVGGGFLGVDVFFVISGFVISRILLSEAREGHFSLQAFFRRRVIRLVPALLVMLYVCSLAGAVLLFSDEYSGLSKHIGAGLTFTSNILLWFEAGYFDHDAATKPLLHLWSLGVEAQFYILWPFIIGRFGRKTSSFSWGLLAITVAGFIAALWFYSHSPSLEFYNPLSRIWEFALGGVVAYSLYNTTETTFEKTVMRRKTEYLWLFLMTILLLCFLLMDNVHGSEPVMRIIPVMASAGLLGISGRSVLSRYCLSNPVARWLGGISYPLYLWHWPLLSFYLIVMGQAPGDSTRIVLSVVALGLAWGTYRYIERPFQSWARTPSGTKNAIFFVGILMAVLFSTMVLAWLNDGWKFRGQTYVRTLQQLEWIGMGNSECSAYFSTPPSYCLAIHSNRQEGVAVLGDSVSNGLVPGVVRAADVEKMSVWNIGKPGCSPLSHVEKVVGSSEVGCVSVSEDALEFVLSEPRISTVVISGAFAVYVTGRSFKTGWEHGAPLITLLSKNGLGDTKGSSNREIFQQGLSETLQRLLGAGKRVIFVHAVPQLGFDPKTRCLGDRPVTFYDMPRPLCAVDRNEVDHHQDSYRRIVKILLKRFPDVKEVDPNELLCDRNLCYGMRNGKLLYRDDTHLSKTGSELLTTLFKGLIKPVGPSVVK